VSYFEGCAVHPHNICLEWLSRNGLTGLLPFVFLAVMILRGLASGLRRQPDAIVAAFVLMAGGAVFRPLMGSMSMLSNNYAGPACFGVAWALPAMDGRTA
jgi:O-antigen ligase